MKERNKKFHEISKFQRNTFVGHRLGTNFSDLQIGFSTANFRKIEGFLKNTNDYQEKFERIQRAIENDEDIVNVAENVSNSNSQDGFSFEAQFFINQAKLDKEKKEFEVLKKKVIRYFKNKKKNFDNEKKEFENKKKEFLNEKKKFEEQKLEHFDNQIKFFQISLKEIQKESKERMRKSNEDIQNLKEEIENEIEEEESMSSRNKRKTDRDDNEIPKKKRRIEN